ncbi:hypothetical protein Y032_0045g1251 [Ancylostoma ceylanicum]|uniref:Uncharacterized protein n=1 Tax=Ancylostoma ceylanicum TaxID=53326 RepID=A0A016UCQ1_9BILA|nr:hypothetical protein Y032_0045g1251 [Ancylostoma ceylanicum]
MRLPWVILMMHTEPQHFLKEMFHLTFVFNTVHAIEIVMRYPFSSYFGENHRRPCKMKQDICLVGSYSFGEVCNSVVVPRRSPNSNSFSLRLQLLKWAWLVCQWYCCSAADGPLLDCCLLFL